MEDRFKLMLQMQLDLQKEHMKDGDPSLLVGDEMANFMVWNMLALQDELHEALQEIGWKPWATSRHINQEAFLKEMVDAFHFFMNLLICGTGLSPSTLADNFTKAYITKNAVNAQRQADGYDAVSGKCSYCHRDLAEVNTDTWTAMGRKFCTKAEALLYQEEGPI